MNGVDAISPCHPFRKMGDLNTKVGKVVPGMTQI